MITPLIAPAAPESPTGTALRTVRGLVALLLALGLLLGDLPAFAASLARLTELNGDVQVLPRDGAWHPALLNEELAAGDAVKTGAQSSATLVRQDGTELELMPFAQLTLED